MIYRHVFFIHIYIYIYIYIYISYCLCSLEEATLKAYDTHILYITRLMDGSCEEERQLRLRRETRAQPKGAAGFAESVAQY